jgi:hypothetical protein
MSWYDLEKRGWSWATGWNHNYGGYYAQAWRNRKKIVVIGGRRSGRECFIEGGKSIAEAEVNLWQRLEQVEGLKK